jgi:hypothetical protein
VHVSLTESAARFHWNILLRGKLRLINVISRVVARYGDSRLFETWARLTSMYVTPMSATTASGIMNLLLQRVAFELSLHKDNRYGWLMRHQKLHITTLRVQCHFS